VKRSIRCIADRRLSAKIKKYVQAQSWFQDLALVEI
jgi:hypothetical protein